MQYSDGIFVMNIGKVRNDKLFRLQNIRLPSQPHTDKIRP